VGLGRKLSSGRSGDLASKSLFCDLSNRKFVVVVCCVYVKSSRGRRIYLNSLRPHLQKIRQKCILKVNAKQKIKKEKKNS
jgi:hypothetical protein